MTSANIFLGIVFSVYAFAVLITFIKSKRFFTALFLTALQGVCALFAVNLIGDFTAVHVPVNAYTIGLSSIGGIAGVIMILLSDIFLS